MTGRLLLGLGLALALAFVAGFAGRGPASFLLACAALLVGSLGLEGRRR